MQKLVIYSALGLTLSAADINYDNALFWCVIALVTVLDHVALWQGRTQATDDLLSMSEQQLMRLHRFMTSVEQGNIHTVEELDRIMQQDKDKDNNKDTHND